MTPLVSKKRLLRFVNLTEGDERYNDVLEWLVRAVSDKVQKSLNYKLEESQLEEWFSSDGLGDNQYLWLDSVVDVTADFQVYYNTSRGGILNLLTLDKDYYLDIKDSLVVILSSEIYREDLRVFKVSYTGGYKKIVSKWDYLEVPDAVAMATCIHTAFLFNQFTRGSFGLTSIGGDDPSTSKMVKEILDGQQDLISEAALLLEPFRSRKGIIGWRS